MNTRRWVELAGAMVLGVLVGVLIGYCVARSAYSDAPASYTVGHFGGGDFSHYLYRYERHSGKTWKVRASGDNKRWEEIAEPPNRAAIWKKTAR